MERRFRYYVYEAYGNKPVAAFRYLLDAEAFTGLYPGMSVEEISSESEIPS